MTYNTEADPHALLDGLAVGDHIKATWVFDNHTTTVEGPVYKNYLYCSCFQTIRCTDGSIESTLTSLEVVRDDEVTVTRDDEGLLHTLLDSLEGGQEVTAEWRNENGSMSITGKARTSGPLREVCGYIYGAMRLRNGALHDLLHSVTVCRPVVRRWEREGNE